VSVADAARRRLDQFYRLPDPFACWEEWQRTLHADLSLAQHSARADPQFPRLDLADVLAEQRKLKLRLLYDDRPHRWLLERARKLEEALNDAR
jgi:hypothetical protein